MHLQAVTTGLHLAHPNRRREPVYDLHGYQVGEELSDQDLFDLEDELQVSAFPEVGYDEYGTFLLGEVSA